MDIISNQIINALLLVPPTPTKIVGIIPVTRVVLIVANVQHPMILIVPVAEHLNSSSLIVVVDFVWIPALLKIMFLRVLTV